MRMKRKVAVIAVIVLLIGTTQARAFVLINEFLADPVAGLAGDANQDGTRHSSEDEFIELYNVSSAAVDIGLWTLWDSGAVRHEFAGGTLINANGGLVIFGGGVPVLPGIDWQTASSGSLSLNNSGDSIILKDASGQVIDAVQYGAEAGHDQSRVRSPEASPGAWVSHTALPNAQSALFSPGYLVNVPVEQAGGHAVPEPATAFLMTLGMFKCLKRRKL